MVERVLDVEGRAQLAARPEPFRQVISRATAKTVGQMMLGTVTHGTARSAFHDPRGRPFLPGVAVAGKTGSLSSERPYRAYSWWIGYAPEPAPTIALAALVVNTPKWRIKASYLARETLRYHLVERNAARPAPQPAPTQPAAVQLQPRLEARPPVQAQPPVQRAQPPVRMPQPPKLP
jgi:cell division protein FtsI/penicillin-binding protein 2